MLTARSPSPLALAAAALALTLSYPGFASNPPTASFTAAEPEAEPPPTASFPAPAARPQAPAPVVPVVAPAVAPAPHSWSYTTTTPYDYPLTRWPERDSVQAPKDSPSTGPDEWMFSLEAVTNLPIDVGGRVTLQSPSRVRLSTGFGAVPNSYLGIISRFFDGSSAYEDLVGDRAAIDFGGGTSWRTQIGLQPLPNRGLYLDAGYSLTNVKGRVYADNEAQSPGASDESYALRTRIHFWFLEAGWQARLDSGWLLGLGLGVMGAANARTSVDPTAADGRTPAEIEAGKEAVKKFDDKVRDKGYLPTLTLRVGHDLI